MCKNKRFIGVVVVATCVGFLNVDVSGATRFPLECEGRFELHKTLPVGIVAGTADCPELVRIEWIRFDTRYGNAWGVTARVGWLPVKDATWRLTIELLDNEGHVLSHSRDEPTAFTGKAGGVSQTVMRYADLDLDAMQDQGRRHAARFRVRLERSQERAVDTGSMHTLEVAVVDQESREPIPDAVVVVRSSHLQDAFRRRTTLNCMDSQGRCRIKLARDGLVMIRISAQKQNYCTALESWSNYGSWQGPIVNLPQRHVLEMARSSSLGGIVQDAEGNAVAGVEVRLEALDVRRFVRTDTKGRWRVDGIPGEADRVTLRIKHTEYGGNNGGSRQITGEALLNARAFKHVETLDKGLSITGNVLDGRGRPVAKATVLLAVRSNTPVYAVTDASGAFRLTCWGDLSVYREAPSLIVEAPGYAAVRQTIDLQSEQEALEFRLKRGRSIACRVVDTKGQPVIGAWTVVQPLPEYRYYSVWLKDTDDRGAFHIRNVPQNDVKLTVGRQGFIAIRDRVVAASEDEVVVTMQRELRVRGTVTDAETGKPIPNFQIAEVYEMGGRTRTRRPVAFVEGAYEANFDEARPETRQLKVTAVGYEPATSNQIKTEEGEREINFKLARSASFNEATAGRWREPVSPTGERRINGMVRDEQGKPVPDAIVTTFPMMGVETITNAKGAFTLRSSGRMRTMREEEMTYLLVRHKGRNLAVAVELDPAAEQIDVTLMPGAILSGKVMDVEGKGIPSAELVLTFWISNIGYGNHEITEIDEAGHYEIRAVPPGHKYSVQASAEGYGRLDIQVDTNAAANERTEVEPLVLSLANLSVSGIVVDDFDQPLSNLRLYTFGNGQPSREAFTDMKGRFTIESVCPGELNIQVNSQGGAFRRYRGRNQTEGGAKDVKIVVYETDQRGRRVPTQPPSLVGKSLPELADFGIKLSPTDIEGKRILVCFWDMNQRPSRHCMTQLAKQIEALKSKGVILVAVQASKVDQNALDEWVKKYNVPFSTIIEGDAKKIRFSWGVQSLPWLILTDRTHIVCAEGFPLSELDGKLTQLGDQ